MDEHCTKRLANVRDCYPTQHFRTTALTVIKATAGAFWMPDMCEEVRNFAYKLAWKSQEGDVDIERSGLLWMCMRYITAPADHDICLEKLGLNYG
jgi:hypothetical protein